MAKTVDSHQIDLIGNFVAEANKIANAQKSMAAGAKSAGVDMKGAFGGATSAVKSLGSEFLAMAGWVGVAATVATAVKGIVTATADAETQAVKLETALKRTGESADIPRVNAWAAALQQATGISDEAAVSLVALGSTMGLTTGQSRELVAMANDMAVTTGTLESNFDALARAADGDTRALTGIARQFNIVVEEGTPAGEVFERIKAATDGAAAAQLHTLGGEWKLFKEKIGNASEWDTLGDSIEHVLRLVNQSDGKFDRFKGSVAGMGKEDLEAEKKDLQDLLSNRDKFNIGVIEGSIPKDLKPAERLLEISQELKRLREGEDATVSVADKATAEQVAAKAREEAAKATAKAEAEASKAAAEAERQRIAALETSAKNGAQAVAEEQQARLDTLKIQDDQIARDEKLVELAKERATWVGALDDFGTNVGNDTTEAARGRIDRETESFLNTAQVDNLIQAEKNSAKATQELQESLTGGEVFGPTRETKLEELDQPGFLNDVEDEYHLRTELQEQLYQEKVKQEKQAATTYGAAAVQALANQDYAGAFENIGASLGVALGNTDLSGYGTAIGTALESGSVVQGITSLIGGAVGAYYGGGAGAAAGASAGATVGGLFTETTNTEGGQAREFLYDELTKLGVNFDTWADDSKMAVESMGGLQDYWNDLAEAVTGTEAGEQGQILAGAISLLGDTLYEQTDLVGSLLAATQDLTQGEGDMLAAQTALFSSAELTAGELNDLVNLYAAGASWVDRYTAAQERLNEAIEAAAATADGTSAREDANAEVEAARSDYISIMAEDAANKEKWEQAVKDQTDVDQAGYAKMLDGVEGTNAWLEAIYGAVSAEGEVGATYVYDPLTGQYVKQHDGFFPGVSGSSAEYVTRHMGELVAPPEKFGEAAAYLASRGYYADTGGSTRTIILQVDGKEMSRVVDKHLTIMSTRTGEVARR